MICVSIVELNKTLIRQFKVKANISFHIHDATEEIKQNICF